MYIPDRCCQVRKTKGNREHRDEFNIATEDTDNQMNLNEHEIRDNWKIETKGNYKDLYIQSLLSMMHLTASG